ncbi:hypothetical protein [Streptomyces sp. CB01881]|uniref:hypothetical protein n=1 Tax=Streptomyces sp. CB01881 TaxID=2078691 RepID=UPI001F1218C7|nr:hypothetical protein [Streptomyces sp. CB01881]
MSAFFTATRSKVSGALAAAAVLLVAAGIGAGSSPAAAGVAPDGLGAGGAMAAAQAKVSGSARISFVYSPDDDIRFTFDVEAAPFTRPLPGLPKGLPTDARGTVRISHHVAGADHAVTSEAAVDCLVTGDRTASFTAVITRADPEVADTVGQRRGFSVLDGGSPRHPDRVGFSWGVVNVDDTDPGRPVEGKVGTCMAPAPFAPVISGDLTVRPGELAPMPAGGR